MWYVRSVDLVASVRKALEPITAVRVAYLFGSRVTGRTHAESDLDIALSLSHDADRHRVELDAYAALARTLGQIGERADLLDLSRCGSAVAFKVLREGTRVLARSEKERIALEAWIMRRYDDEAPRRKLFRKAAKVGGP